MTEIPNCTVPGTVSPRRGLHVGAHAPELRHDVTPLNHADDVDRDGGAECASTFPTVGEEADHGADRSSCRGSIWKRISRELLATTATDEALCKIAATTGDRAPLAPIARPIALTAIDIP